MRFIIITANDCITVPFKQKNMKNETEKWRDWMYARIKQPAQKPKFKALSEEKQKIFIELCRSQKY